MSLSQFLSMMKKVSLLLHFHFQRSCVSGVVEFEKFHWILHVSSNALSFFWIIINGLFLGNTNGSSFEVYALLGEVYGSGCPLGYLLIRSSEKTETGGKSRYITELLKHFKSKWKINPIFNLTDKDISEINAFLEVYPDAKHQLCFWHCLRALKTRISILRRRPKTYDVVEAHREFPWIEESFVPIAQSKETNPVGDTVCI